METVRYKSSDLDTSPYRQSVSSVATYPHAIGTHYAPFEAPEEVTSKLDYNAWDYRATFIMKIWYDFDPDDGFDRTADATEFHYPSESRNFIMIVTKRSQYGQQ